MTTFAERRLTKRVPISFRVKVETSRGTLNGIGRDLSEGGVSVFLKNAPPMSASVEVSFQLPGNPQPMRVTGEVMHQQREAGAEAWVGIRFLRMDAACQQAIRKFVKTFAENPPVAVPPPLPRR